MNLHLFEQPKYAIRIEPVIDYKVIALCRQTYHGHPKGCPNWGIDRCPPKVGLFDKVYDTTQPVYAVVNDYDLGAHMQRMKAKHPHWTDRQLRNVLYWQQTARKQLEAKIRHELETGFTGYTAERCPEGMGVHVTRTLENAGITLEWPPMQFARQVAFLAVKR